MTLSTGPHLILFYDYVPDIVERRAPHREAHLARIGEWTADGRIMWSTGMYGFRDEAALYDNTFQQYGQISIMNGDGSGKRLLTDSRWEDAMPLYIPARAS